MSAITKIKERVSQKMLLTFTSALVFFTLTFFTFLSYKPQMKLNLKCQEFIKHTNL